MSRDIRFRAWDKKEKNASTLFFYPGENDIVEIKDISSLVTLQFTGLKDVYEGDILKAWHTIVPVVWTGRSWDAANPDDSEEYVVITDLSSDDLYSLS